MSGIRRRSAMALVAASVVAVVLAVPFPGGPVARAEVPPIQLPELPPELDPVLGLLSPITWGGCGAANLAATVIAIGGVPVEVRQVVDPLTGIVFGACTLFPVPPPAPTCPADAALALPTLGRLLAPFAIVLSEAQAAEALAAALVDQVRGVIVPPLTSALGCSPPGRADPGDPLAPAPTTVPTPGAPVGPPRAGATPRPPVATTIAALPVQAVAVPPLTPTVGLGAGDASDWSAWRVLLVVVALLLGAFGLPRVRARP